MASNEAVCILGEIGVYVISLNSILLFLIMSILSCSSARELPKMNIFYKMDISIENKEHNDVGMTVLPLKELYTIKFKSPGKIDLFTFRTCSREIALEKAGGHFKKKEFSLNYRPNKIENESICPADIGSYEKIKGRHAWGYIDFEDSLTTLEAESICGGKTVVGKSVTVCQGRIGLVEKIEFKTQVIVRPDVGCELKGGNRGNSFEYEIKKGFCVYAFMEIASPFRIHRHTTYGYEKILIRGD